MHPDDPPTTPLLTRIGWFFWAKWNRAVCAIRGHDGEPCRFCGRCGLPLSPFDDVNLPPTNQRSYDSWDGR